MRNVVAVALLLAVAVPGLGQVPQAKNKETQQFLIPLDALGDVDRLADVKGVRLEGKCSYRDKEQPTQTFTWIWHSADKWRFDVRAPRLPEISIVVNGDEGWLRVGPEITPLKGEAVRAMTDQVLWMGMAELTPLASKAFQLTVVGDTKVKGKAATCVKAAAEGWRDAKLYFATDSRLLVKAEFRGKLTLRPGGQVKLDRKLLQEFYFSDYQQTDGLKHWRKIAAHRNGRPSADFEVSSVRFLRQVNEKLFRKPGSN